MKDLDIASFTFYHLGWN